MGTLGSRRRPPRGRAPEPPDPDGTGSTHATGDDPPADPDSVARTICLDLLTARARSRAELAEGLAHRRVDDAVAARVLDRLGAVGLLDDAAFAGQWVSSRHRHQGLGRRALAEQLHRKGVDRDTVTTATAGIGRDEERARARALVDRRLPALARHDHAVAARRLVGMLARKGYGAGVAYEVVREALAERAAGEREDTDEGAAVVQELLADATLVDED